MLQKRSLPYRLAGPPRVHGNGSCSRAKAAALETLTASCCYVLAMVGLPQAGADFGALLGTGINLDRSCYSQPTEACAADRCDKIPTAVSNCASAKKKPNSFHRRRRCVRRRPVKSNAHLVSRCALFALKASSTSLRLLKEV